MGRDFILLAKFRSLEAPSLLAEIQSSSSAFMLCYQSPKIEDEFLRKVEFVFVLDRSGSTRSLSDC